ncbi:MAG: sigma-70 family RNA polymerase sigma factor [Candidatus Pacebacteria bacterium]|nr:sigma-70 family RNA polymerase sigma factor [Candidatus Paceibacterota bacterium]
MAKQSDEQQQAKIEALVKKAQAGNTQAFAKIYQHFADSIYRFCLFKVSNKQDAQDLTSETFQRIWRFLDKYQQDNFRAYLFTTARNLIYDHYKKKAKENTTNLDDCSWLTDDEAKKQVNKLIDQETYKQLYRAMKQLPDHYREVIQLRIVEELSIKETTKVMNRSSVSVRVLQHRALKKLRKIMNQLTKKNQ